MRLAHRTARRECETCWRPSRSSESELMMATDDKVAFYLRHRTLIEEWAALREQAAAALEEAFSRAVGLVSQRPDTPEIVKFDSDRRYPMYGISLQVPGAE